MPEHFPAVEFEAFAELDRRLLDELLEDRLAFDQRQFSQVPSVQIKQIERDQYDLGGLALQLVLQHRKIGGAVRGRDDHLAVDDGGARVDQVGVAGDLAETLGPVVAATGEHLDVVVGDAQLDAVAVELDFMQPAGVVRHLIDLRRERRRDETGEGCLRADRGGLGALKSHQTSRMGRGS